MTPLNPPRGAVARAGRRALASLCCLVSSVAVRPALAQTDLGARDSATPEAFAAAHRAAEVAVGVGDRVRVRVWREPTMSDDFVVDDRGSVTLPRLGPMMVAGRSIASVRDTLLARFAEYLKNPSVDVTVLRRVAVQGEVRVPNLYYVDATKSIREVIAEAGGPTDAANRDHVALMRDGRTVAVGRWSDGGPVGIDLRSGDEVVVARRSWLSLNALAVVGALGVILPVGFSVVNSVKK